MAPREKKKVMIVDGGTLFLFLYINESGEWTKPGATPWSLDTYSSKTTTSTF